MAPRVSQAYRDQRHQSVLQAADRVFVRLGYNEATMEDVRTEAGLSRGGLYRYFWNKSALFRALLEEQDHVRVGELRTFATNGRPLGPQILELFTAQIANSAQEVPRARMIIEFQLAHRDDEALGAFLRSRAQLYEEALAGLLSAAAERGELRLRASAAETARYLLGLHDGVAASLAAGVGSAQGMPPQLIRRMLAAVIGIDVRD